MDSSTHTLGGAIAASGLHIPQNPLNLIIHTISGPSSEGATSHSAQAKPTALSGSTLYHKDGLVRSSLGSIAGTLEQEPAVGMGGLNKFPGSATEGDMSGAALVLFQT